MKARHEFTSKAEWLAYLRVHFAGLAMEAMSNQFPTGNSESYQKDVAKEFARASLILADALLAELEKPTATNQ